MIQFHRICADHDQSCTDTEIARSELFNSVFSAKELFHPFKHEPNISLTGYESKYRHFFSKEYVSSLNNIILLVTVNICSESIAHKSYHEIAIFT